MQTVWSRVAQARTSCHCASCTVKTSVTRHTATAAGKRPTRYLTTSTLLYSGIFAVAATTDALVKEKRRQKWDEAIADVKEGVAQAQVRIDALADTKHLDPKQQDTIETLLDESAADFEDGTRGNGSQAWPESSGNPFEQGNFAPQSIWASDRYRARLSTRWTPKKLRLHELAIDQLTVRALMELDGQDLQAVMDWNYTEDFQRLVRSSRSDLSKLSQQVSRAIKATRALDAYPSEEELQTTSGVLARFAQDANAHHMEQAAAVERGVKQTVDEHSQGRMTTTKFILRTLHDIATSPAPPTLGIWNHILQSFSRRAIDSKIAQQVIRTMRTANVRMNEHSMVAIMEHYIRTNDAKRFTRFIETMQGMHHGLCLAHPEIYITSRSNGRLVPVDSQGKRKVVQKPVANPLVLGTLIEGVLHFNGFAAALEMCRSIGQDGWGLSMRGLTPLLRECAKNADWNAGQAVWRQIKRVQELSAYNGRPERVQPWTYATMLRLCQECSKPQEYKQILDEAVKIPGVTPDGLTSKMERLALAARHQTPTTGIHPIRWRSSEEVAEQYMRAAAEKAAKEEQTSQMLLEQAANQDVGSTPPLETNAAQEEQAMDQLEEASSHMDEADEPHTMPAYTATSAEPPRAARPFRIRTELFSRPSSGLEDARMADHLRLFRPFGESAYI